MMDLIRKVETALELSGEIPMWGFAPHIKSSHIQTLIREALELPDLRLSYGNADWKEVDGLMEGLGETPLLLGIHLSPLAAPLLLAVPRHDAHKISRWVLGKSLGDAPFQEGFFHFACTKVLAASNHLLTGLTPKLAPAKIPDHAAYTIDLSLVHDDDTLWCRLICSSAFHAEYKFHYATHPPEKAMEHSHLPLTMTIEVGSVDLKLEEWEGVKNGDFIILDACSYRPSVHSGTALILLKETPIFQAKLKEGKIKLLEYADILEERPMAENFDEPQEEREEEESQDHTPQMISAKEIPFSVHVEVGRFTIPLNKLIALKPGNILELEVRPEQGVLLTAQGRVIGRGELLQVGETLGVKITDVAS